ncbi:hypothetical protein G3I13_19585 [Streptomyces sp. SID6673]|nr:hypothetical protein [Streptomyces sp. SID11726]NEB26541.1 hypothetical protein [Streptomyces sp. SID6673]NED64601.1 hypothetical protein [Streptomyces sp. SID10244]
MAKSDAGSKGAGALVIVVLIIIAVVVKFWYVFVAAAAIGLLVFATSKLIKANSARRAVERADRASLLDRCEQENAAYNQDPDNYLRRLEGDLGP